jgi:hypothetical protein
MSRATWLSVAVGMLLMAAGRGPAAAAPASGRPRVQSVTLLIRHRIYHDFQDLQSVTLNRDFLIGDTEYTGRIVQYVPDFEMDLKSHKVISRSSQPNNPAFRIVVRQNQTPKDTTWAFVNMPPHFGRRSYFAFQVMRIDFDGRRPVVADTAGAQAPPAPAAPHPAHSPSPATRDTTR